MIEICIAATGWWENTQAIRHWKTGHFPDGGTTARPSTVFFSAAHRAIPAATSPARPDTMPRALSPNLWASSLGGNRWTSESISEDSHENDGALEYWSMKKLEYWSDGILEYWSPPQHSITPLLQHTGGGA